MDANEIMEEGDVEDRDEQSAGKEQDHLLPIHNITKIMKKVLPSNAKLSKEARQTMQECASEFISFITSEASDISQKNGRKTITGDDLLTAMNSLGFDSYLPALEIYLQKYRESSVPQKGKRRFVEDHSDVTSSHSSAAQEASNDAHEPHRSSTLQSFPEYPTLPNLPTLSHTHTINTPSLPSELSSSSATSSSSASSSSTSTSFSSFVEGGTPTIFPPQDHS